MAEITLEHLGAWVGTGVVCRVLWGTSWLGSDLGEDRGRILSDGCRETSRVVGTTLIGPWLRVRWPVSVPFSQRCRVS